MYPVTLVQHRRRFRFGLTALVFTLALIIPLAVFADNVQNDVVAGGNDTVIVGNSTTINYRITATGSDGCNASDSSPATVNFSIPSGVTVVGGDAVAGSSGFTITFNACSVNKSAVLRGDTVGDKLINAGTVIDAGGGI
jgi:hypothetical protein